MEQFVIGQFVIGQFNKPFIVWLFSEIAPFPLSLKLIPEMTMCFIYFIRLGGFFHFLRGCHRSYSTQSRHEIGVTRAGSTSILDISVDIATSTPAMNYSFALVPVVSFVSFSIQEWLYKFYLGPLEKFENAALFPRLGLPSTLIRRENGAFRKPGSSKRTEIVNCVEQSGKVPHKL